MYSISQGFKNIGRHMRLSLASIATVTACIFLFCIFFSLIANLRNIISNIETKVGITVFFDEGMSEDAIKGIGAQIEERPEVKSLEYTSAEEAWEQFKEDYFEGREELAEGFSQDNPLKESASYTIFLKTVEKLNEFVSWLESVEGVRQVNYSSQAGSTLSTVNKAITVVSLVIIGLLLFVSVILIRNTIAVSAEFRKTEIGIQRLIGATNYMIKAPFVIEGVVLGFVGAALPLIAIYFIYNYAVDYAKSNVMILGDIMEFLPITTIMPYMGAAALVLGVGMGLIVSSITINKYMRV